LWGILTRFYFHEFRWKEFFNTHACFHQLAASGCLDSAVQPSGAIPQPTHGAAKLLTFPKNTQSPRIVALNRRKALFDPSP
jgi:hypothetical protein